MNLSGKLFNALFLCFVLVCSCKEQPVKSEEKPAEKLFTLLTPEQSGVDFQNTLTEGLNTNILMYEYFYNGGGVACWGF